jgi:cephalosporin-C deacetylase
MVSLRHPYTFDPTYGYDLTQLLAIAPPPASEDFASFWRQRYRWASAISPRPVLRVSSLVRAGFHTSELEYWSTDGVLVRGWLLVPANQAPRRGFVVGHGYGGIDYPDFEVPCADAIYLVPCFRGLARSRCNAIPASPERHVLHGIEQPDQYVIGGCVDDLWIGVTTLLELYPDLRGQIGYLGISFGGGIGALAMAWDERIAQVHLNVPTFGHQPLRLGLPTIGSAAAVQDYLRHGGGNAVETLAYYDAAVGARYMSRPVHIAAALFDPAVAPPGQFAVYNALAGPKRLQVLTAGHFDYPERPAEDRLLLAELREFFGCDEPRVPPVAQSPPGA